MKKASIVILFLLSILTISAQAGKFLHLTEAQLTPEVFEEIRLYNQQVRGPSFNFTSSPYNLPDNYDQNSSNPDAAGVFYEDVTWIKDFTRHINNPDNSDLYLYYSSSQHFNISMPDPANPLKLQFDPIPEHWYGSELMVITVSDAPLDRTTRATATAIIRINVTSVPDPPIFFDLPLDNTFYIVEDDSLFINFRDHVNCIDSSIYNFDLYVAQTQFSFPYSIEVFQYNPGNLEVTVPNGQLVKFLPQPDYNGSVNFIITAVDRYSNGFSTIEITIVVTPVNDPPEILSYSPTDLELHIDQNTSQLFTVNVIDVDGDPLTQTWTLSGVENGVPFSTVVSTTNSLDYYFNLPGTFILDYEVNDGLVSVYLQWTIHVIPVGPIFDPTGGVFDHVISVTLTPPPGFEGAVIYYTLDGSIPVVGSPTTYVYNQPIDLPTLGNIENITTISAIYIYPGYLPSQVVSYTYRITGRVADPVFDPVGGLYYAQTTVEITCPNLAATIYYTTDGSDPVPGNPGTSIFTDPIIVPAQTSMIIKAFAIRADWIDSNIVTHIYNVTGVVLINTHVMNPPPLPDGEFYTVIPGGFIPLVIENISLTPPTATLYYTMDNSTPGPDNPNSFIYTPGLQIELTCPTWIKIRAYNPDWAPSIVISYYYDVRTRTQIMPFPNGTIFEPAPGIFTVPISVSINTLTNPAGAPIYYTTDGSEPVEDPALLYTGPIYVNQTTTIKVMSHYFDICPSEIYEGVFEITGRVDIPNFDPPPGTYYSPLPISMSTILVGTTIYYTLDGSEPLPTSVSPTSYEYTGPVNLPSGTWFIRARAYKDNWDPSFIREGNYSFGILPPPAFNLPAGNYYEPIVVRLTVPSVPEASIFYTLDGTDPDQASTLYDDLLGIPIGVMEAYTIKARAWAVGWQPSTIAQRSYSVTGTVAAPTFNPGGGSYAGAVDVTISTATAGATIKYTLDGQDPSATYGFDYTAPVNIAASATLKARAFKPDWGASTITTAVYTIFGNIANPVFTPAPGTYTAPVDVYISVNPPDASIYYTTDGTPPSAVNGTLYTPGTPINIASDTNLAAIAVKPGWNDSGITEGQYIITGTIGALVFSPPPGQYASTQNVSITANPPAATIIYTLDGTEPSQTNGFVYSGPINIPTSTVIKAYAYLAGWNDSPVAVGSYIINGAVSTPVFVPSPGYYNTQQSVSISVAPADATIIYTLDGSDPSRVNGITYSGPVMVSEYTQIKAFAYKDNWLDSGISSGEYFFVVANPQFSVPGGSYADPLVVSLSVSTPGAIIRYTTDGSDPSESNGIIYDTPINIDTNIILKAIAYRTGWLNSNIVTHAYYINGAVSDPVFSVPGGNYYNSFSVGISVFPTNAVIYYTTDGSEPSQSNGSIYNAPIAVNGNITLKARAYLANFNPSGISTASYDLFVSPVIFTPSAGTYTAEQIVSLSTVTPGATIWYTTDGNDPVPGTSPQFDPLSPILVDHTLTIKAIATLTDWHPSSIGSAVYIINIPLPDVALPGIQPPSGVYTEPQTVSITTTTPDATIIYTLDGSDPTLTNGEVYTAPFMVSESLTIKARAFKTGWNPSPIAIAQYIIVIPMEYVQTPTFNPGAGVYTTPIVVFISTATPGATIRYTLDGTEPSEAIGTIYTEPVNISETTTVKAIAYKTGMYTSLISNASYVINPVIPVVQAPVFSPPSGLYQAPIDVEISTATPEALIVYTLDGLDPNDPLATIYPYTGPIPVPGNSNRYIKAIAYKEDWTPSPIVSANYIVTGTVAEIDFNPAGGTYTTTQNVVLTCATEGTVIRYTTDGTDPVETSAIYTTAINVPAPGFTIKARGYKTDWLPGPIGEQVYTITGTVSFMQPVLSPSPGTFNNAITVAINDPIPVGADVYYTLDGTDPTLVNGILYNDPIPLNEAKTIKARAYLNGWAPSTIVSGDYAFAAGIPVFDPPAGSYPEAINVAISSITTGASIYYTNDGTDPTPTNGTLFTGSFSVSVNQTIKARAYKDGYDPSPVVTAIYAIGAYIPMVETPMLTPASGIYTTAQTVSMSTTTPEAIIYYTLNGSEPDQGSSVYTTPVSVPLNTTMTIKAKAFKPDWLPSATATEVYVVTGTVANVSFNPVGGTYTNTQNVVLSTTTPGAYIRYTINGDDPDDASAIYSSPINTPLNQTTTIKARAYKENWSPSEIGVQNYNITGQVVITPPVFSPPAGNYTAPQIVSISDPVPATATVRYTTDGSIPTSTHGTVYTAPFVVDQTTVVRASAYLAGWEDSPVYSVNYSFGVQAPVFAPVSGTYPIPLDVTITTATEGASIRYTTDGSNPTPTSGILYSGAIHIPENSSLFIKAIAYREGWTPSAIVSANYIVTGTVADVQFSPAAGIYTAPVSVVLTTSTPGAAIHYTLDGSEPTPASNLYTTAIIVPLNTTWTIRAKAFRSGWISSNITQQTYTVTGQVIISAPVFSVPEGTYTSARTVNINSPVPTDATVHFTTDGSDPTTSSPVYSAPITVPLNTTLTIKARAFRDDWIPSPIYAATYVVTGQVTLPAVLFDPPAGVYQTPQSVILNPALLPANATLRYTLDGSEPSLNSPAYQNPILLPLNSVTTIKAKGFSDGWIPSPTVEATYNITGQVVFNTPVFDPSPGVYTTAQTISVNSTLPSDATVYYTTDGSEPTLASMVYTTPIELPLDSTLTLKVKAFRDNWTPSETHTGAYTTTGEVSIELPVFTPAPGLYTAPQMVSLNTTTIPAGATLHYTLDGSDPNDSSPVYTSPIQVNTGQTVTIRVRAYAAGWLPSTIHTGTYTVTGQVSIADPVFTPPAGIYATAQVITLNTTTMPAGATLRYTLDGSEPTPESQVYTTAIPLGLTTVTTIKVKAYLENWIPSETYSATYTITGPVYINAPVFTPPPGTYQTAQSVSINTSTTPPGATIRYTTDGSEPTATSPVYTAPIAVGLNTTMQIKAKAFLDNYVPSDTYSAMYIVTGQVVLPTPMFNPPAGTYQTAQNITLNTNTTPSGATLRYTLDGSEPDENSPAYSTPIALPQYSTTTIKVKGFKPDWTPSITVEATYEITGPIVFNQPVFTPAPGIYTSPISVTVAAPIPPDATVRYTLDGSEPTATSPQYTAPIPLALNTNTTIKVKAFKANWTPSATQTGIYTITGQVSINAPVFTPTPGIYTEAINVSINTSTVPTGAQIRYTLDGTDPTPSSPLYTTPIPVNLNSTANIRVRAYATNWDPSELYLGEYTVTGTVIIPDPVFTPPAGTYATAQTLVLNTNTTPLGATLRYTTNGDEPTETSQEYTQPIPLNLNQDITIKVRGYAPGWIASAVHTADYHMTGTVDLATPVFDPAPGIYSTAQSVAVVSIPNPAAATIRYTINGDEPTEESPEYTEPITIPLNTPDFQIRIRAFLAGWNPSAIITGSYTITGQVELAAQPFTPAPGTYTTAQTLSIAAPTLPSTATLRYTLDGSEPTLESPAYTAPVTLPLNSLITVRIRGFATNWEPSEIISGVYNITGTVADPVFSPPGGNYSDPVTLTLSTATEGAEIRYTLDGTEPTQASELYTEPIVIPELVLNRVISAKAFKTDWIASATVSHTYTVLPLPYDVRAFTYGGYIRVLWNSTTPGKALQGFNVYRRRITESSFEKLNTTLVTTQLGPDYYYDDYAITVNVSYVYYITAVYDGVESLPSVTTTVEYQSQSLQISDASYAYPNPAESSTRLKLVLTRNDNVQIAVSIYDFAGKKVQTLTVPATNSNLIEIPWDLKNSGGKKVGRGTYFARIVANDSVNRAEKVIKISVK